jgi:hypothetical protein
MRNAECGVPNEGSPGLGCNHQLAVAAAVSRFDKLKIPTRRERPSKRGTEKNRLVTSAATWNFRFQSALGIRRSHDTGF